METENKKTENPNAFPCLDHNEHSGQIKIHSEGMTLRDYFAAKAMQSLLSNQGNIEYIPDADKARNKLLTSLSKDAFDVADAMLKEREKN